MGVVAPQLCADLAILDAELTLGTAGAATAYTGIDAMVHAIEAYTSAHLKTRCRTCWPSRRWSCCPAIS